MTAAKTVFLHAGTHKTGTTSLQTFFTANAAVLRRSGILVPRAGRAISKGGNLQDGHHNLAWELNDIKLFAPQDGTFEDLLAEIRHEDAPSVFISSEDLEWLHGKPAVLAGMAERFAEIGYRTAPVLYLRAQPQYVTAIYVEGSKSGFLMNYRRYLDEILRTGAFVPDPRVINRFEYGPLVDAFAAAFGSENLNVRGYEAGRPPEALLLDMVTLVLAGAPAPGETLVAPGALNTTPSMFDVLAGMHAAVLARDPSAPDPATLARDVLPNEPLETFARKFDVMTADEERALLERFAPDNRRIERAYGARIRFCDEGDLRPADSPQWKTATAHRRLLDAALEKWQI